MVIKARWGEIDLNIHVAEMRLAIYAAGEPEPQELFGKTSLEQAVQA